MTYSQILERVLDSGLSPVLEELGFGSMRGLRWRRGSLEMRVVVDSKSGDPFRGAAFTLEFEQSPDGHFERKLAGRARIEQLLDAEQRARLLQARNEVALGFQRPDADYLARIPEDLRSAYLRSFDPVDHLESRPWLRFAGEDDARLWARVLSEMLPTVMGRAEQIDPHALVLGKPLGW